MDDILKNISDEELFEMAVTIKLAYSWNTRVNNWDGHHFIAPNGWRIQTSTIPGAFGVPNGENVSVYNGNDLIKEYKYVLNIADPYYRIIKGVNDRIKYRITGLPGLYTPIDISTAVGEFLCAKALVEGKHEKDVNENIKEKEELNEEKKANESEKEIDEEKITNIQLDPKEYHSYDYKSFSIFAYHYFDNFGEYPSKITFYIYKEKLSKEDILDGNKRLDYPIWDEVTYSLDGSIDDRFSNYFKKRKKELSNSIKGSDWDAIYKIETEIIDKIFSL